MLKELKNEYHPATADLPGLPQAFRQIGPVGFYARLVKEEKWHNHPPF